MPEQLPMNGIFPSQISLRYVCFRTVPACLNLIAIILFVTPLLVHWEQLTPCFQRQGIVVAMTLVYWLFKDIVQPSYLIESLQFLVTFILTERLNSTDQDKMETCLQATTVFTKVIYSSYFFLFGYYIGTVIVFVFLLLGAIMYDCYYGIFILPQIRRERSIRGKEFDELEVVKYSTPAGNVSDDQIVCSICLTDFQEQEMVIRLPICCHHFHKKCIQTWLENHKECPYCRADIRSNLQRWKANDKKQNEGPRKETVKNLPSPHIMINSPDALGINAEQNNGSVYIELRDS